MGSALRRVAVTALLGLLWLAAGAAHAQMGMGMGARGPDGVGAAPGARGNPRDAPTPSAASEPASSSRSARDQIDSSAMTGQMPAQADMGHQSASRPFYQERTFLVLVGVAGAVAMFLVVRAIRRSPHRPAEVAAFQTEAVLVIDVVGSTHLATQYGEAVAMQARSTIKERVLNATAGHGLRFAENTGDGCLATFGSVEDALATARAVLEGLRAHPPDLAPAPPLEIRVGIAWGEILFDDRGSRHGAVINKAFRLENVPPTAFVRVEGEQAHPPIAERNRVFLDEAAAEEARARGVPVREVGVARLKGFPGLHRVYEVAA